MAGTTIGLYVLRALQILFGAVVLGLSVWIVGVIDNDVLPYCGDAYEGYYCGILSRTSTAFKFGSFVGAFGLVDAFVGIVAVVLTSIPWLVPLVLDGLALIFYLASGVNSAVIRGNDFYSGDGDYMHILLRWSTSTAFMFLGFLSCIATMVLVFLRQRSGSYSSSSV